MNENTSLNEKNEFGRYPIQQVVESGDYETLLEMTENGADVNIDIGEGWTPLHTAFDLAIDGMVQTEEKEPDPDMIKVIDVLLKYGADLERRNNRGLRAIDSINTYSGTSDGFELLIAGFSTVIPGISEMVTFKK